MIMERITYKVQNGEVVGSTGNKFKVSQLLGAKFALVTPCGMTKSFVNADANDLATIPDGAIVVFNND